MATQPNMSMTVSQMVKDLKYASDILQLNIEDARRVSENIQSYLERTNMLPYRDQVKQLTKEQIDQMTIPEINQMFPGHELVPWFDPVVKDLPGDYGYTDQEYHDILNTLNGHLVEYDHMVHMINQSIGYVQKMAITLQETRQTKAKELIRSGSDDGRAQQYLDDLDAVNSCSDFFSYIRKNKERIRSSQTIWLERHFQQWANDNPVYKGLADRVMSSELVQLGQEDRSFLLKCIYSYLRYRDHSSKRTRAIWRDVMFNLNEFFIGNVATPDEIRENIQNFNWKE